MRDLDIWYEGNRESNGKNRNNNFSKRKIQTVYKEQEDQENPSNDTEKL